MKKWICPFCKKPRTPTHHHVLPKRHFGENPFIVLICRKCHNLLERLIPANPKLPTFEYFYLVWTFWRYGDEAEAYIEDRHKILYEKLDNTNK